VAANEKENPLEVVRLNIPPRLHDELALLTTDRDFEQRA